MRNYKFISPNVKRKKYGNAIDCGIEKKQEVEPAP